MADLTTDYLGLSLRNPLVVAASGLVSSAEGVRKAAEAGAGAVVLKSLFEEQLRAEASSIDPNYAHPEAADFLEEMGIRGGAGEYLELIRAAKAAVSIPVIASVNCVDGDLWVDFAEQVEAAGADALELNVAVQPRSSQESSKEIEDRTVAVVRDVSVRTSLPVAVKIGAAFTNPLALVERLAGAGAGAVVLFNRFHRVDVDLASLSAVSGPFKGGPDDYYESLRWIARLYGSAPCALVASGGVHSAETALKLVSAGAQAVQVCSAIYRGGWKALATMAEDLGRRLDGLGVASVASLRGRASRREGARGERWERLQYIKALTGIA